MQKTSSFLALHWKRIAAFALVLVFLVCSVTVFAKIFTNPETYKTTIQSIDEKKLTVLGVSAAVAGSSTLLSSVPGDATAPLANKLMDLSSYLLLVVCILVLEKSLLTVFGAAACYVLFPIACILTLVYIVQKKQTLLSWAARLAILALALLVIVPASMKISDYIYEVNQVKLEQSVEEVEQPTETETDDTQQEDNRTWWQKLWNNVTEAVDEVADTITATAQKAIEEGKAALNNFTNAVAVFVIAYCAIPVFVVFLFLWLLKILFSIEINPDISKLNPRNLHHKKLQASEQLISTK